MYFWYMHHIIKVGWGLLIQKLIHDMHSVYSRNYILLVAQYFGRPVIFPFFLFIKPSVLIYLECLLIKFLNKHNDTWKNNLISFIHIKIHDFRPTDQVNKNTNHSKNCRMYSTRIQFNFDSIFCTDNKNIKSFMSKSFHRLRKTKILSIIWFHFYQVKMLSLKFTEGMFSVGYRYQNGLGGRKMENLRG